MSELPAPPRGCPDSSILAAFIEGTLDAQTRREVERHVAECPECPGVIAETARFLSSEMDEAEGDPDPPPRREWRWLAAAAVAALCTVALWQASVRRDPLWKLKQIMAESPARPVEGWLTDFDYAPFPEPRSDRKPADNLALRAEAERLNENNAQTASSLHARGVALLLTGDAKFAVSLLEKACRLAPESASNWNDLATAYIAARTGDRAVAAADRAIALSPRMAAAHFNRAIALESLGKRDQALSAYRRANELDPQSESHAEIARRIAQLEN
jgi:tetratricopeptide (TPR) repeat protein